MPHKCAVRAYALTGAVRGVVAMPCLAALACMPRGRRSDDRWLSPCRHRFAWAGRCSGL